MEAESQDYRQRKVLFECVMGPPMAVGAATRRQGEVAGREMHRDAYQHA